VDKGALAKSETGGRTAGSLLRGKMFTWEQLRGKTENGKGEKKRAGAGRW